MKLLEVKEIAKGMGIRLGKMNKAEIIKRLMSVDNDMSLLDTTADTYSCIIVGGSALVLLEKIYRSTHDIDSINASDEIKQLLEIYNINMNVSAYRINFPDDYLNRIIPIDIPTKKLNFILYRLKIWWFQNYVQCVIRMLKI